MREIQATASSSTHLVPLIWAVKNTKGIVIELGCGDFSTPILHELLRDTKRKLFSYENEDKWFKDYIDLQNDWHKFNLIRNWNLIDGEFSVALIDHHPPENRLEQVNRLRNKVEIFVLHDVNLYDYKGIENTFKYSFLYNRFSQTTFLLSNKIDVSKINS